MAINFWQEVARDSKKILGLATPIILSSVTVNALAITDTYFISRLISPIPLAGYGLVMTFALVFIATIYGFLNPLVVMIGQAFGKKQNKKIGEIVRIGCLMSLIAGGLLGLLLFCIYFFLGLLGQPPLVIVAAFG
ncbi:MAG: MATE family efflux transporter, partial [Alphaproteobacteria bacterium]